MKLHHRLIVITCTACVGATLPWAAAAQPASAPAAVPAAPAAAASRPERSLPTPADKRDDSVATPTPRLRIEGPVPPQIKVPLGRKPLPPRASRAPEPAPAAAAVDDEIARCNAQVDETARASCRDRAARSGPPR